MLDYLVVGGGGAGGSYITGIHGTGGGGAGGFITGSLYVNLNSNIVVTVGFGGSSSGLNGKNSSLGSYAGVCGLTLARAHARTGDPIAISAYLGESDVFDNAILAFSKDYADQTERDHAELRAAIDSGKVEALEGI
jgi:hypothetical protein